MHELSVAESIVAIANAHAAGGRVVRVEVKVGQLRQVVPSALAFAFPIVARGTPAEGAALVMEEVSVVGRCRACGGESEQPALQEERPCIASR
jgi:hydrogenase nickel incorporation protein HypA/HybF